VHGGSGLKHRSAFKHNFFSPSILFVGHDFDEDVHRQESYVRLRHGWSVRMNDVHVQPNPSIKTSTPNWLVISAHSQHHRLSSRSNQDQADSPVDIYGSVFVGPVCRAISFVEREQAKTENWNWDARRGYCSIRCFGGLC